jgi:hypothetical protein
MIGEPIMRLRAAGRREILDRGLAVAVEIKEARL